MIVTLLKQNKKNYYSSYFIENQNNVEKNLGRYSKSHKRFEKENILTHKNKLQKRAKEL